MFRAGGVSPQNNALDSLRQQRARLQEQMKTIPRSIRGGSNEFGQNPMPAMGLEGGYGPKYNPTQQEINDLARYKSILTQQNEIDSQISSMMPNRGGLGVQLDSQILLEPPRRPGGMENLSGSLGGQIRPNPYSAPQMPQMGGGYGGGQGMQKFMQFMQTMMQMFQQLQGGGGRGMGGGFQGQMRPRPQTYGRSPYGGY